MEMDGYITIFCSGKIKYTSTPNKPSWKLSLKENDRSHMLREPANQIDNFGDLCYRMIEIQRENNGMILGLDYNVPTGLSDDPKEFTNLTENEMDVIKYIMDAHNYRTRVRRL